ncbi:hypothetical protein [Cereibacter ovatus]|nr:hypothetical protein [Cereibacter ovatus]
MIPAAWVDVTVARAIRTERLPGAETLYRATLGEHVLKTRPRCGGSRPR